MNQPLIMTPEELKARKRRNMWLAMSIVAFIVLVFAITMAKLLSGQGV